jgi:hypothetical protein
MILEFWTWWFGVGWSDVASRVTARVAGVWQLFSVGILIRTLFYPWKRIVSPPAKSFDAIMRGMLDNAVSRFVGLWVRLFAIIAALFITAFTAIIGVLLVICWPLLPLLGIFFLVMGVMP